VDLRVELLKKTPSERIRGWTKDQWGHYHKGDRRFKLSTVAVRLEVRAGSASCAVGIFLSCGLPKLASWWG